VMLVSHDGGQHVTGSVTQPWSPNRATSWSVDSIADVNVLVGTVPGGVTSAVYRAGDGSITPLIVTASPGFLQGGVRVLEVGIPFDANIVWGRVPDQNGELLAGDGTTTAAPTSTAPTAPDLESQPREVTFRATGPDEQIIPSFALTLRARPGSLDVIRGT
jgi:hypothetical protein